jgi:hypothetical protein
MQKIKRSIDFTIPQIIWLTKQAEKMGLSVGEFVRRLIDKARLGA